ncbi:MAG: bifunctional DNA-formamidopyrimidine glycosylase/DNA-(apurinic or apyrimidinic site) lyase [Candidatus Pacebacteria bacterium]|nr:bifunctional DNA-formamidopyrimidine glycosylase/DNA-(apurinic or apyrimidinic site) lyase [Candidatus Paceibacterota bacterium]MDD5356851.1 bifunctional DNA-formamidopyrimidine glycosylase/DNA-(apurinic or apyrimidinic site) lyase [Candidatus Paceibacterota bacterium]
MPELPEVQTTAHGVDTTLRGLNITDAWTDYNSSFHSGKGNIKNPVYFKTFRNEIVGKKILGGARRGKNVLIHLSGNLVILVHMKMTGHLLYGKFSRKQKTWVADEKGPLQDPFNKFIHLVFSLSNGKQLALSDMRKFAKVCLTEEEKLPHHPDLAHLGPEPLDTKFSLEKFQTRLMMRPNAKIKQALMDQTLVAGIGNIYSDEILWASGIHPETKVLKIPVKESRLMYTSMKELLLKGIDFGGDSMSDYRNLFGERGRFQAEHHAYRLTGKKCSKYGCKGIIKRLKIGGRSAHFCSVHQKKW